MPPIRDQSLFARVLTHRSYNVHSAHGFEYAKDTNTDYEQLEHLGDSVLNLVATTVIREKYPLLTVGSASVSHKLMVRW